MGTSKGGIENGDGRLHRTDRRRVTERAPGDDLGDDLGPDSRPFDLGRGEAHPVAFLEHLVGRDRLGGHPGPGPRARNPAPSSARPAVPGPPDPGAAQATQVDLLTVDCPGRPVRLYD